MPRTKTPSWFSSNTKILHLARGPYYHGPSRRPKRAWTPGYSRTGGFYGRFNSGGRQFTTSAELKFFDTALNFSFDNTAEVPATGQLNLIPQGVTQSTRVGRKAFIKSIQFQASMRFAPASSSVSSATTYMVLVLDKQANGAAAANTLVYTSNDLASSLRNLENSERFTVLKRWVYTWNPTAGVATALNTMTKNLKYYKKLNVPIEFDSSASTGEIGTIRSNNLFLLTSTSQTADDLITLTGRCRVRYSD